MIYVELILRGLRYFGEVPYELKEEVRSILYRMNREDLLCD